MGRTWGRTFFKHWWNFLPMFFVQRNKASGLIWHCRQGRRSRRNKKWVLLVYLTLNTEYHKEWFLSILFISFLPSFPLSLLSFLSFFQLLDCILESIWPGPLPLHIKIQTPLKKLNDLLKIALPFPIKVGNITQTPQLPFQCSFLYTIQYYYYYHYE